MPPNALVTGASRGIGRGISLELAKAGYNLAINYTKNEEAAAKTVQDCKDLGVEANAVQGDIADLAGHQALLQSVYDQLGAIHLLVNNAGIAPRIRADMLENTADVWDEVMDVNVRGPYFLTQKVAQHMLDCQVAGSTLTPALSRGEREHGAPRSISSHPFRIVFITSFSAYVSSVARPQYCASKAALSMVAQLWADRLAEHGIPVFEIRPGIIKTDMTAGVTEKYDQFISDGGIPQRRWGTPEDVGKVVTAIAGGDLDYSTGQIIEVSGGFNIRSL